MNHKEWLNSKKHNTYEWLDHYLQYAFSEDSSFASEDAAVGKLFRMNNSDWKSLEALWVVRDDNWKKQCAALLWSGPDEGQFLLKRGLSDPDAEVRLWAASSLCGLVLKTADESENYINLDSQTLKLLKDIYEVKILELSDLYSEIESVISSYKG